MRDITDIIIHCTATRPNWMQGRALTDKVAEIRHWHVDDRGFADIGYHYLIDRDGTVAEGRPVERPGAHTYGHNANSIGIALIGGHGGGANDQFFDHFTPAQDRALRDVITQLEGQFGPARLSGHNEYAAKACPCFKVRDWFAARAPRTSPAQSTTLQATAAAALASAGGVFTALGELTPGAQIAVVGLAGIGAIALGWIARERLRKWAGGDR
jgi:hypothetical protein